MILGLLLSVMLLTPSICGAEPLKSYGASGIGSFEQEVVKRDVVQAIQPDRQAKPGQPGGVKLQIAQSGKKPAVAPDKRAKNGRPGAVKPKIAKPNKSPAVQPDKHARPAQPGAVKQKTDQPTRNPAVQPDTGQKPIRFVGYVSESDGAPHYLSSNSVKVEGEIGADSSRLSFLLQEMAAGKVGSRFHWRGIIQGEMHSLLMRAIGETKFKKEETAGDSTSGSGSGNAIFEVSLRYMDGNTLTGTPVNLKEWRRLIGTLKEFALSKKSEKLTGFRCYIPPEGEGAVERGRSCGIEIEGNIGTSNTVVVFASRRKPIARTAADLEWSGEVDGELHRKLLKTASSTSLKNFPVARSAHRAGGDPMEGIEVTLRYPDGERTGTPLNLKEWEDLIHSVELYARGSADAPDESPGARHP